MSQPEEMPKGDPWRAFGYIVAGVAFYGFVGWLADRWLETRFLVAVGILVGAGLGIYMTAARFRTEQSDATPARPTDIDQQDTE